MRYCFRFGEVKAMRVPVPHRSGLSTDEAECFPADVRRILESAFPHISAITCPDRYLDIRLDFDRRQDAELVESRQGLPGKQASLF